MSESVEGLSDAIWQAIGGFIPQDRGELGLFFGALPGVFTRLAGSLEALGTTLTGREVSDPVLGDLRVMAARCHGLHDLAAGTQVTYVRGTGFWRDR
jgi:hypothetical protein